MSAEENFGMYSKNNLPILVISIYLQNLAICEPSVKDG